MLWRGALCPSFPHAALGPGHRLLQPLCSWQPLSLGTSLGERGWEPRVLLLISPAENRRDCQRPGTELDLQLKGKFTTDSSVMGACSSSQEADLASTGLSAGPARPGCLHLPEGVQGAELEEVQHHPAGIPIAPRTLPIPTSDPGLAELGTASCSRNWGSKDPQAPPLSTLINRHPSQKPGKDHASSFHF